jgi:ADP-ribosylglycohydrolase
VAEEALAIALYCALVAPDFASAVRLAVNHGGDSDSTGAITGNLLGASLGEEAIPTAWRDAVEIRAEIERMADELYESFVEPGSRDPGAV